MKFNWNQPIIDLDGNDVTITVKGKDDEPVTKTLTVGEACVQALSIESDDKETGENRFKRATLLSRIYKLYGDRLISRSSSGIKADDNFTSEDVSFIKPLVKKYLHPVTMLFVIDFLEGNWKRERDDDSDESVESDA